MTTETSVAHTHISTSIRYMWELLRERERDGAPQQSLERDGEPVSYAEAYAGLALLESDGKQFIALTGCDNEAPDGSCAGHTS